MLRTVYAPETPSEAVGPTLADDQMLAATADTYGPPEDLVLTALARPRPDDRQVLIEVAATTVNPADWHLLRGEPYIARLQVGLRRPKYRTLGCEVAGTIVAVGSAITDLAPGDEVFANTFMRGFGGFAEYALADHDMVVKTPAGVSAEAAATLALAGCTALQALRDHGRVEAGQRVLVIGASGGVGTFATQLAKHFGAEVTAVCSGRNRELVVSLGADRVIDYRTQDLAAGGRHDLVLHLAGDHSIRTCRGLLADRGTLLTLSGDSPGRWFGPATRLLTAVALNPFVGQRLGGFTVAPNAEDMSTLAALVADGSITPVIDRTHPLAELDDALTYLETGRARGKVVITPDP